jgi:phosphatidate cytidylyltransferase
MTPGQIAAIMFGCFGIGATLIMLASRGTSPETRRQRWLKFSSYFIIVTAVLGCASLGRSWLAVLVLLITATGCWELHAAGARIRENRRGPVWPICSAYALLTLGLFTTVMATTPRTIAFLYLTVAAFDGFSEVFGHLCGRHLLIPSVSPGKTWEGLLGGEIGAIAIAVLLRELSELDLPAAFVLGATIGACALLGDLSASWVKRRAGIKDFSSLLPGQGGVLDRFDSFIGAGGLLAPLLVLAAT